MLQIWQGPNPKSINEQHSVTLLKYFNIIKVFYNVSKYHYIFIELLVTVDFLIVD